MISLYPSISSIVSSGVRLMDKIGLVLLILDKAYKHQKVSIKASTAVVKIYSQKGILIGEHQRATRKGQWCTNTEQLPKDYNDYREWNAEYFIRRAKLKKEPLRRKAKELGLDCSILGILASESYQREKDWLEYGCNVFHERKDNQSRPLSFWTDEDILEYIERYNVKISKLYKMGYTRNGCMYCGFGVHLETPYCNRYQKLKHTHPAQYTYFLNNFGQLMLEFEINIA